MRGVSSPFQLGNAGSGRLMLRAGRLMHIGNHPVHREVASRQRRGAGKITLALLDTDRAFSIVE
jgi:hypothetical protein